MTNVPWRYSLCNEMFEGWALADVARLAAELGYQGVELAPYTFAPLVTDLSAADRAKIRRDVEDVGLEVSGLHWLLARTPFRLNTPDAEERGRAAEYLLDVIDFCADVGGHILVFGSPQQRDPVEGYPTEHAWASTVEVMRRCGERAEERGVIFCIEPLGTPFITWVDDALRLVRQVDRAGFRMIVDCKSMGQDARWAPAEQMRYAAPWFKHVHVNDPNLLGPGMGELDFRPILATLRELRYDGWVSLEAFQFPHGPEQMVRQGMANLLAALESAPL